MGAPFIKPDFAGIPTELRALPRWLVWRGETRAGIPKPAKVPYRADLPDTRASSTDPDTWCSFEQAEAAYLDGDRDGVGLVLDGTDNLAGVDIDGCRDAATGTIDPRALALLERIGAGYVEVSPSGTGLRAFGYAEPLKTGASGTLEGLKVELYSRGRYLTLTGRTIKAGPLAPLRGFGALADRIRGDRKANPETGELERMAGDERYGELVRRILSGDVFHDSLRDLAASLVAAGMQPGAVVSHLRGLMDACAAPHDERWRARRKQIPELVRSAEGKFTPAAAGTDPRARAYPSEGELPAEQAPHPLATFVPVDGQVRPPRWVVPGFIAEGLVMIAGEPAVGKTTCLLPLALVVAHLCATGNPLRPRHWRHVVFISEDVEQARRVLAGARDHGTPPLNAAQVAERFHLVEAVRMPPEEVVQVGKTYRERFARMVEGVEVLPLVVIDTRSAVLELEDENSNSEGSQAVAAIKQRFEGLPTWVIGHLPKSLAGRNEARTMSMRGAGAWEADAHQTLFIVREGEQRFIVLGKRRFEPEWQELAVEGQWADMVAPDEFGVPCAVRLRWGVPMPPEQSRQEAKAQAAEAARRAADADIRDAVRDAVQVAQQVGYPLTKEGVKAKVPRKAEAVARIVEALLAERWLVEVPIPSGLRTNPRRSSFLVNLNTEEHDAVLRGEPVPAAKLTIPASMRKAAA